MTNGRGGSALSLSAPWPANPAPLNPVGLAAAKSQARTAARARRARLAATLSKGDKAALAAALAARLLDLIPMRDGVAVAGYAAIHDELDILPILERLHADGAVCALPVVAGRNQPLAFRRWQPGDSLLPAGFGVPEPLPQAPPVRPSIVLAPLLAFDRSGNRIGYGAGFYDRTLAALRRSEGGVLAIGLAHSRQEMDAVPAGALDQPLDWVITEGETIACAGARLQPAALRGDPSCG